MVKLTSDQQAAVDRAVEALSTNQPLFRIGGYAGTGKTTVLKEIIERVPGGAPCAYTGKAASVLVKKGIQATTVHSRIYKWVEALGEFQRVPKEEVRYKHFDLDEGSMIGGDIFADMQFYGLPILAVGDPGQLEPISKSDVNLMKDPDVVLTEIHRQAQDNPIIDLATRIRLGQDWGLQDDDSRCVVARQAEAYGSLDWADVIICGYNRTRVEINKRKRQNLGHTAELEEGDKIICLQNDKGIGIFNGLMFDVLKIKSAGKIITRADVRADDGRTYESMPIWMGHFNRPKSANWKTTRKYRGKAMIADYGYAITCHKSQGSEWDKVVVINQAAEKLWNQVRWLYTATTRASKELRLFK